MTTLPVTMAFNEALDVATSMPGWTIVSSDIDAGCIEASQQSRWFRFTDDIVIRGVGEAEPTALLTRDRKSTPLNSSHQIISYALFCFKKKISIYIHCQPH